MLHHPGHRQPPKVLPRDSKTDQSTRTRVASGECRGGARSVERGACQILSHVLHDRQTPEPETVRARRPPLPGARWPSWRLARPIALVQGNARQGPPTLRHQCQRVQDLPSLELNRRLVVRSRLSEVFSAVNGSVGPSHLFVISSNLTSINARTIGSVLTLHRHFHLSPLDPLARRREGSAEGATCSVAQSKRDGNRDAASVRSEKVLGLLRIHWPLFSRYSPLATILSHRATSKLPAEVVR